MFSLIRLDNELFCKHFENTFFWLNDASQTHENERTYLHVSTFVIVSSNQSPMTIEHWQQGDLAGKCCETKSNSGRRFDCVVEQSKMNQASQIGRKLKRQSAMLAE